MGAVEHLKTLCCLGVPPESAMVAAGPGLHEIMPGGSSRIWLCEPGPRLSAERGRGVTTQCPP